MDYLFSMQMLLSAIFIFVWALFIYNIYYRIVGHLHRCQCKWLPGLKRNCLQSRDDVVCMVCHNNRVDENHDVTVMYPTLCCNQFICRSCYVTSNEHDHRCPTCRHPDYNLVMHAEYFNEIDRVREQQANMLPPNQPILQRENPIPYGQRARAMTQQQRREAYDAWRVQFHARIDAFYAAGGLREPIPPEAVPMDADDPVDRHERALPLDEERDEGDQPEIAQDERVDVARPLHRQGGVPEEPDDSDSDSDSDSDDDEDDSDDEENEVIPDVPAPDPAVNPALGGFFAPGVIQPMIGPDNQIVDNRVQRTVRVNLRNYRFPNLQFFGYWNDNPFSPIGTYFNEHFGFFLHNKVYDVVTLPSTLVDELSTFWAGRQRTLADLLACYAITKTWLRGVGGITSEQYAQAAEYAPAIAMHKSDTRRQNIARVFSAAWSSSKIVIFFLILFSCLYQFSIMQLWYDTTYRILAPIYVPPITDVTQYLNTNLMFTRAVAGLYNIVADLTVYERPVLDCGFWHLPQSQWYICSSWYDLYFYIQLGFHAVSIVAFVCSLVLVRKEPTVIIHALSEDVGKVFLGLCLSKVNVALFYLPGLVVGVIETHRHGRHHYFLYHLFSMLFSNYWFMFLAFHILFNFYLPEHAMNVRRLYKKFRLSNVSVPPSQPRAHSSLIEPPFTEVLDREKRPEAQHLFGIGSAGYRPVGYSPNYKNEHSAVAARIVVETPEPDMARTNLCIQWVKANIRSIFPKMFKVFSVDFEMYLKNSNASSSVKRTLRRTHDKLVADGIDEFTALSPQQLHEWTRRKAFVKVENNVYRTPGGRKNKASRLIQGAPAEFICLVGPWMMAFQSMVKKQWGKKNFMCFTSGVNALDAAKVIDQPDWIILEDDIGAFDASVNRPWLQLELWIFKLFGCPKAVYDLIKANIDTHGVTSKGIRYKRQGMRKSGDPYTSVGNSLLNGLMHLFIYCEAQQCSVAESRHLLRMLIQGDDNLMRYVPGPQIDWVARMLEFGFTSEAVYRPTIFEAEFCSNLIYETDQGLVFAPKPGKVFAKLGYYINPPHHRVASPESIVRGTALGLYNACHHIPIMKAYLDHIINITDGVVPHKTPFEEWKMKYTLTNTIPGTHQTMYFRYGWSLACDEELGKAFSQASLGEDFTNPLFQLLCDRDTSGPQSMYINRFD